MVADLIMQHYSIGNWLLFKLTIVKALLVNVIF